MKALEVDKVGDKTRQALKWSISSQIIQKIVFLGSSVILARLLTPADFGLSAMCITLDTITWIMLSLGVIAAVMHFQDNIEERLCAAFWLILVSSSVLVLVQILAAPMIASFYKEPLLIPILRTSAIALLITSFSAVQRTILAKNLEFKKISILETCINTFRSILYIVFALCGFGVWSFIYPKIIVAFLNLISLWNITNWRPQFKFYFKYWGEMLGFGKNVLFSNIIDYIVNNSGYILIGNLLGSSMLGIYTFAYDKSMLMINSISAPIASISFPAFARLQNHRDKLKAAYHKAIKSITLLTFPFAFAQLAMGNEFIIGVFGEKWRASVLIFQIIIIFSISRSVSQCSNPILQAVGRPDLALNWSLVYAPTYIMSIFLGFKLGGIYGIATSATLTGVIGAFIYMGIIFRTLNWPYKEIFQTLKPAFVSSAVMGGIVFAIKMILLPFKMPDLLLLSVLGSIGLVIYAMIIKVFFSETYTFVEDTIKKLLHKNADVMNSVKSSKDSSEEVLEV